MAAGEAATRREQIKYLENQVSLFISSSKSFLITCPSKFMFSKILDLLLPPDPNSAGTTIRLQLIAGAGGLEAAMFARDLFNMYKAYVSHRGWSISHGDNGVNALKDADCPIHNTEVIIEASEPSGRAYACFRWEAGVHRVQRIPATSKLNKIHTSTVAVTVLPAIDEVSQQ